MLHDLKRASITLQADQEVYLIKETLQLSQDGLNANPNELAGQLLARIHGTGSAPMIKEAKEMMEKDALPAEAVEILNLLEAFEINHQNKQQVRNVFSIKWANGHAV